MNRHASSRGLDPRPLLPLALFLGVLLALAAGAPSAPGAHAAARPVAERDTSRAHPYYRRGLAFFAGGRMIEALRQFQNATFFDPDGAELRYAQGLCLLRLDEPAQARVQFERHGYFCVDPDTRAGAVVFNRTVSLKDSWAKEQRQAKSPKGGG